MTKAAEIRVPPESLEWAITHLLKYGDSDITTVPFEYRAMKADWSRVKKHAASINLATHKIGPVEHRLAVKPGGTLRVATRLDPIDCLLFTGIVSHHAGAIEKGRVKPSRKRVFSYRISLEPDGSFFRKDSQWEDFQERSRLLAKNSSFVVIADIADFYSQISLHRAEGALEMTGVSMQNAKCIESFLSSINANHSRGLPVGPHASIIIAEACLHDVDMFLIGRGWKHTRYVDDFRVFCKSADQAREVLRELTWYLHTSHRLTLQASKTSVVPASLLQDKLDDHAAEEKRKKEELIEDAIANVAPGYGDDQDEEELDEAEVAAQTLKELMKACLREPHRSVGMMRYILRRAAGIRTNVILSDVLSGLEKAVPAMRDLAIYLDKVGQNKSKKQIAMALDAYMDTGEWRDLALVREWLVWLLASPKYCDYLKPRRIRQIAKWPEVGLRSRAAIAKVRRDFEWVRQYKETWRALGAWDRRAIIHAADALPEDECRKWLASIHHSGDTLDAAVAQLVLSEMSS